jgi:hypothetical protein
LPVGLVSLVLAVGSYASSFTFIDRAQARRGSFIFYTTIALVFTLAGIEVLLEGGLRVAVLAAAALVTSLLGSARGRATLNLHGSVYLVAAALGSRLPAALAASLGDSSGTAAAWASAPVLLVLAVAAVCAWSAVATHGATWGRHISRTPKLVAWIALLCGLGGLVVSVVAPLLPAGEDGAPDDAALAVLRTVVLAAAAIALAWVARVPRLSEAGWLVYPVLAVGGAKLLVEDLQTGRPLTLFVSFALYGSALILAPRLARLGRARL